MSRRIPVEFLGAGAVAHYREAGWHISEGGRPHAGVVTGPCAGCSAVTVVYGARGNPLCPEYRNHLTARENP